VIAAIRSRVRRKASAEAIRKASERPERQLGVHRDEDHDDPDQRERRLEERHDPVADERVERLDVVREAADHDAGPHARVEAERERLEVLEQLAAQVLQRALADPAGQVGLRGGGGQREQRGGEEDERGAVEPREVAGLDRRHRPLRERDRRERCGRREDQRQEHQRDTRPVRPQQLDQPAQLASAAARLAQPAAQLGEPVLLAAGRRQRAERAGAEGADALVEAGRAGARAVRPRVSGGRDRRQRRGTGAAAVAGGVAVLGHGVLLDRLARQEHLVRQALLDDLAVEALLREQLLVRAVRGDPAALQHDDLVGERDRREAMRDHERGAALHHLAERQLDLLLGGGVDRGGRVVEHEDAGVREQRARDRDALALAA
jgi:hypothetical protein